MGGGLAAGSAGRRHSGARGGFTFVDLFAGAGGFHVAMDQLGGRCVYACEIDEDCRRVYERNFGMVPAGDINSVRPEDVPDHEILCAGFPCQPFSKSGSQGGILDTRGTLFHSILGILGAKQPRYAILENVRNLAGPNHRETWDTIIRSLWSLGYRVSYKPAVMSPHMLPPELGGRPQSRDRVFILCERVGAGEKGDACLDEPPRLDNRPVNGWRKEDWRIDAWLEDEEGIRNPERYALRVEEVAWIDAWNDFIKRVDEEPLPGFPIWADAFELRPAITGEMPAWERNIRVKNSELYARHKTKIDAWLRKFHVATFPPSRRRFEWQARGCPRDLWRLALQLRPSGIRAKAPTYLPALVAITQTSIVGSRRRRVTPREAARLQGFPDTFILHPDDRVAYKQMGNAVNVGVVRFAAERLMGAWRG